MQSRLPFTFSFFAFCDSNEVWESDRLIFFILSLISCALNHMNLLASPTTRFCLL